MLGLGQVGCQLSLTGPRLMNPCRQPGSGIWPDHHLKLPRVLTVLSLGFLPNLDIPLLPTHLTHTPCAVLCVLGRSVVSPALHFIFRMVLSLHLIRVPTLLPLPGTTSFPSPGEHPFNPLRLSSGPITSSGGGLCRQPQSPLASPWQPILQHRARWWKWAHQRSVYATEISSKTQRLRTSYSYLCL